MAVVSLGGFRRDVQSLKTREALTVLAAPGWLPSGPCAIEGDCSSRTALGPDPCVKAPQRLRTVRACGPRPGWASPGGRGQHRGRSLSLPRRWPIRKLRLAANSGRTTGSLTGRGDAARSGGRARSPVDTPGSPSGAPQSRLGRRTILVGPGLEGPCPREAPRLRQTRRAGPLGTP